MYLSLDHSSKPYTFNALLSHRNRQFCEGNLLCNISTIFPSKSASSVNLDHYSNKRDIYGLDFVIGWLVGKTPFENPTLQFYSSFSNYEFY